MEDDGVDLFHTTLPVTCFFCGNDCTEDDDWCFGCHVYICGTCDGAPTWILLDGPQHQVWMHRYQEIKTVEARVRQAVEGYTAH